MQLFGLNLSRNDSAQTESWFALLGEGLRDLLPKGMQRKLTVGDEYVDVTLVHEQLKIDKHTAGVTQSLGQFSYLSGAIDRDAISAIKANLNSDTELHLSLSADDALSKSVQFPKVVANNLKQTVGYEMSKHTPFDASQVYYDVVQYGESETQALAQLTIVQKSRLDRILADFAQHGIKFNRAIAAPVTSAHNALRSMNLLPANQRRKTRGVSSPMLWLYGLLVLGLLAALVITPLLIKRNTAIRLEREMAELAQKADGERELWVQQADKLDVIESFMAELPVPFSLVIEDISRRLDNSTHVTEMQYQTGQIVLRGKSKNASALTDVLKKSPFITDAVFQSSIVSLGNGDEGFRIALTLAKLNEVQQP